MPQVVVDQAPPFPDPVIAPPFGAPPWETLPPSVFLLIVVAVVTGAVFLLGPLVRALATRIEGGTARKLREEVMELRTRLESMEQNALQSGELGAAEQQIYELEERVEFVERLMSRGTGGNDAART